MTSFDAKQIVEDNFMANFKIEGQVYHCIRSLFPAPGVDHQFLQIYFISLMLIEFHFVLNIVSNLREELITVLQKVLLQNNNLIGGFKHNFVNRPLCNREN